MRQFQNRVAVITGAASGIGRALAQKAAQLGMRVVLSDIDEVRLSEAVREVEALGAEALGVRTDVGSSAEVAQLADQAYARFGAVHVLVNNAGVAVSGAAWLVPLEVWERSLRINLHGVLYGVHTFVPRMLASGEPGHVVNVASAAGLITVPGFSAYSAGKFGVVGMTEALYHDLALRKLDVGVSLLCPSWVQTRIASDGEAPSSATDPVDAMVEASVKRAVESGIAPELVADAVFAAIAEKRFYILTHEDTSRGVAVRSADIVQGRAPTMATMEKRTTLPPR